MVYLQKNERYKKNKKIKPSTMGIVSKRLIRQGITLAIILSKQMDFYKEKFYEHF